MKQIVNKIIDKVQNFERNRFDLDDIDMPDDDSETTKLIKSVTFKNTHELKAVILEKIIYDGPNADLSDIDVSMITSFDWLFSLFDGIEYRTTLGGHPILTEMHILDYIPYKELKKMPRRSEFGLTGNEWSNNPDSLRDDLYNIFRWVNPNISTWDISRVKSMNYTFFRTYSFNCDISGWQTDNVKSMYGMFYEAHCFNQNISHWNMDNCFSEEIKVKPEDYYTHYLEERDSQEATKLMFVDCLIKDRYKPYPFLYEWLEGKPF